MVSEHSEKEMATDSEVLEILAIGSLYRGPSEKKYWSTSRGKDRYPYPVGYLAQRTFCGEACKIEIVETPEGPMFTISSADGNSFSGQSPDMAWNKFQKKVTHTKLLRGKRLSSPCNGTEFFGFKNSLVLRLLRELGTNINDVQGKENSPRSISADLIHPQVGDTSAPDSNPLTISMMTLLLPQAIPLLEDPSRERVEHSDSLKEATLNIAAGTEKYVCTEEEHCSPTVDFTKAKCLTKVYARKKPKVPLSETIVPRNTNVDEVLGGDNLRLGDGSYEYIGCYRLPMKVEWVLMRVNASEIFIGVVCASSVETTKTFFHYKLSLGKTSFGVPCLLGHSPLFLNKNVPSSMELSSNGDFLAVLGSVTSPHCSYGKADCNCHACASECGVSNSVNILKIHSGYTAVVLHLEIELDVRCLLTLSPNLVLVSGDDGMLHVWAMGASWSFTEEKFSIEGSHSPVVQLKKIPSYNSFVLGFNGTGEFLLWDLSKRALLTRFHALDVSLLEFVPICLLDGKLVGDHEEAVGFKASFLTQNGPAIGVIVSTGHRQNWRLGLLAQGLLILGNPLDPRAVACHAFDGNGIIGTVDGILYGWELLYASKVFTLYDFKGGNITCVVSDSSSVAVAEESGNVLIFRRLK